MEIMPQPSSYSYQRPLYSSHVDILWLSQIGTQSYYRLKVASETIHGNSYLPLYGEEGVIEQVARPLHEYPTSGEYRSATHHWCS